MKTFSICLQITVLMMIGFGLLSGTSFGKGGRPVIKNWLCYYGKTFGYPVYSKFDLVVLDAHHHPPLHRNDAGKPILIGYLSVGEVDTGSSLWTLAENKPFLVKKNEFWNSWMVDVRSPDWQTVLFQNAIPSIIDKGFDGFFLDTLDSSLSLTEGTDKAQFEGTDSAVVDIVRSIREKYPEKYIVVNRGFRILANIAPYIDIVVIEDLYSLYTGKDKGNIRVDTDTQNLILNMVQNGVNVNPDMTVLTLDYADYDQKELITEAISFSRSKGFIPYVSTYMLDQIFFYSLDQ